MNGNPPTARRQHVENRGEMSFDAHSRSKPSAGMTSIVLNLLFVFFLPLAEASPAKSQVAGQSMPGQTVLATASSEIDDTQFFVTQHYRDFLNREPDDTGLAFWMNEISSCGNDPTCLELKRIA